MLGLRQPLLGLQGQSQVIAGTCIGGFDLKRLRDQLDGCLWTTLLQLDDTEPMQRLRLLGIRVEDLAIDRPGFLQVPGLMVL